MALHDLTPQLRTRLSRVEKAVGWFMMLAVFLLVTGLFYFVKHTAYRKGWFIEKIQLSTCLKSADGLKPGDPVKMMGSVIGEITAIVPNDPWHHYNVTVFFEVRHDTNGYWGYVWTDSKMRAQSTDWLGGKTLELVKGRYGIPVFEVEKSKENPAGIINGVLNRKLVDAFQKAHKDVMAEYKRSPRRFFGPYTKGSVWFVEPEETQTLSERLEHAAMEVEKALPNILSLTNSVARLLDNVIETSSNLNQTLQATHPAIARADTVLTDADTVLKDAGLFVRDLRPITSNLTVITALLSQPQGALGDWLFPTNITAQIHATLQTADFTVAHNKTNLDVLVSNLNRSLDNLAGITGGLHSQVRANSNVLAEISNLIRNTDTLVQGLRLHWFFRSAFKPGSAPSMLTNLPAAFLEKGETNSLPLH